MLNQFTDMAWVYLNDHINTQNNRYCRADNTTLIHELLLHDIKVWTWCAINVTRINGPTSFFWHNKFTNIYYTNLENVSDQARENSFFTKMVQPPTDLPYAACLLTGQFTILYSLLTYPIWWYVTIFCGEPQKTVYTRTIKTHCKN